MQHRGEYRTFDEWLSEGRAVRKGQKAEFYLVSPDGTESRAAFAPEQTDPNDLERTRPWVTIVPAAERPEKQKAKPKVKLDYDSVSQILSVWVGANTKAIKILQKNKFEFSPSGYRWWAKRPSIDRTYDGFEQWGFQVEAKVDGQPWSPAPITAVL